MSQPHLPVAPDPRDTRAWLAYIADLYPDKVELPADAVAEQPQAAPAEPTPEQAALGARFHEVRNEAYDRLSAPKRAQGHGDCSDEMAAATREALEVVRVEFPHVQAPPAQARPPRPIGQPIRVAARPRERRAQRSSRSTSSSSDDPDLADEPPAPGWHWAHPAWRRSS